MATLEELAAKAGVRPATTQTSGGASVSLADLAAQAGVKPKETPKKRSIFGKAADVVQSGVEKFAQLPGIKQLGDVTGKVVGTAGEVIGSGIGTIGQVAKNAINMEPYTKNVFKSSEAVAKETGNFGYQTGKEAVPAAVLSYFGGPAINTALAYGQGYTGAENLSAGIKSGDEARAFEGALALGTSLIGTRSAVKEFSPVRQSIKAGDYRGAAKDLLVNRENVGAITKPVTEKYNQVFRAPDKMAEKATQEYRSLVRPSAGEIKNIEVRGHKDIDDAFRIMAEENVRIKRMEDNKMDTLEAVEQLQSKTEQTNKIMNEFLRTDPSARFKLLELADEAKKEFAKTIKNADELRAVEKDVDDFIRSEIERYGANVNGETLNKIKGGFWSLAYDMMKPTRNTTARKLGFLAKEMIEKGYTDLGIRRLNQLTGRYATAINLLRNAHGRVVKGGRLGGYAAKLAGAVAGSPVPLVGNVAGYYVGGKVADYLASPERATARAGKYSERAGIGQKSYKEGVSSAVKGLVERKPKFPLLKAGTAETPRAPIALPRRMRDDSGTPANAQLPKILPQEPRPGQLLLGSPKDPSEIKIPLRGATEFEKRAPIVGGKGQTPRKSQSKSVLGNKEKIIPSETKSLEQEARKYKSAEEFVGNTVAKDSRGVKITTPFGDTIPLNQDGTITVYHRTTPEIAQQIKNEGLKGSTVHGEQGKVYFSTNPTGGRAIGKEKTEVLKFEIDPRKTNVDEAFRDGSIDLVANEKDLQGVAPKQNVQSALTKSQLTDIWKKANKKSNLGKK